MNPLTELEKNSKGICMFNFGILTKISSLQGTIVQNSLVTHLQMICSHFKQFLGPLEKKLIQVSSDGQNMNLYFS